MNICNRCHLSQLGYTKLPTVLCNCPRLSPPLSPFSWYMYLPLGLNLYNQHNKLFSFWNQSRGPKRWYPTTSKRTLRTWHPSVRIPARGEGEWFSLLQNHLLWGSPSLLFNWYRGSFPRVKRSESKADHSPPSTAVVKNEWSYTSAPPICLQSLNRDKILTLRCT